MHKYIIALTGLIVAIAGLLGLFYKKNENIPSINQNGNGNVTINGDKNSVNLTPKEKRGEAINLKKCTLFKQDPEILAKELLKKGYSVDSKELIEYSEYINFNKCITSSSGGFIELEIWLGDELANEANKQFEKNRTIHVYSEDYIELYTSKETNAPTTIGTMGNAVLVEFGEKNTDSRFSVYPRSAYSITGYFKIISSKTMSQGTFFYTAKAVRLEDIR